MATSREEMALLTSGRMSGGKIEEVKLLERMSLGVITGEVIEIPRMKDFVAFRRTNLTCFWTDIYRERDLLVSKQWLHIKFSLCCGQQKKCD